MYENARRPTPICGAATPARPGSFTVWYADEEDRLVGVLTYNADDDAARGRELVAAGAAWSEVSGDLRGELRTDADA